MKFDDKFSYKTNILNVFRQPLKLHLIEKTVATWITAKKRPTWFYRILPNHYQYPKGSIRKVVREGIAYELDIGDFLDWHIYYGMSEGNKDVFYDLIKTSDVVFDVGANIGETTLMSALRVGAEGKVYSFEPDPTNNIKLKNNISLNSFTSVVELPLALSDETKEYFLCKVSDRNPAGNRIRNVIDEVPGNLVKAVRLDDFTINNKISCVNIIKVDVEGFEYKVLLGAKKVIERDHPKLFVELDDSNLREQGSSASALLNYLLAFSYKITRADNGVPLIGTENFENCHFDIVCI